MAFKKFASLMPERLFLLNDLVSDSLAPAASMAPSTVPSPAGRSTVCSCSGTFGAMASGFISCCLRSALAAMRRCFFDLAIHTPVSNHIFQVLDPQPAGRQTQPICCYVARQEEVLRCDAMNIQNKSPSAAEAPAPALASPSPKIPHNQLGYSASSSATGSCFPFV